jgi:hypothetical protein
MTNQKLSQAIPFLAEFIKLSDYMKIHATKIIQNIHSGELDPDEKVLCLDALANMLNIRDVKISKNEWLKIMKPLDRPSFYEDFFKVPSPKREVRNLTLEQETD